MLLDLGTTEGKLSKYVCSIHTEDAKMRKRAARRGGTIIGHIERDNSLEDDDDHDNEHVTLLLLLLSSP